MRETSAVSVTTRCRNAPLCMASVSMLRELVDAWVSPETAKRVLVYRTHSHTSL